MPITSGCLDSEIPALMPITSGGLDSKIPAC